MQKIFLAAILTVIFLGVAQHVGYAGTAASQSNDVYSCPYYGDPHPWVCTHTCDYGVNAAQRTCADQGSTVEATCCFDDGDFCCSSCFSCTNGYTNCYGGVFPSECGL